MLGKLLKFVDGKITAVLEHFHRAPIANTLTVVSVGFLIIAALEMSAMRSYIDSSNEIHRLEIRHFEAANNVSTSDFSIRILDGNMVGVSAEFCNKNENCINYVKSLMLPKVDSAIDPEKVVELHKEVGAEIITAEREKAMTIMVAKAEAERAIQEALIIEQKNQTHGWNADKSFYGPINGSGKVIAPKPIKSAPVVVKSKYEWVNAGSATVGVKGYNDIQIYQNSPTNFCIRVLSVKTSKFISKVCNKDITKLKPQIEGWIDLKLYKFNASS